MEKQHVVNVNKHALSCLLFSLTWYFAMRMCEVGRIKTMYLIWIYWTYICLTSTHFCGRQHSASCSRSLKFPAIFREENIAVKVAEYLEKDDFVCLERRKFMNSRSAYVKIRQMFVWIVEDLFVGDNKVIC